MSTSTGSEGASERSAADPVPVAVIGCGRMGRLHARVYSQMPQVRLIGVVDSNAEAAAQTTRQYGGRVFSSVSELIGQVGAVTIATPTVTHLEVCLPLLKAGIACLIEKPLATDVREAQRIAEAARQHGALVQVGHIERFNPAVRSLRKLEIHPRYIEVTRISPLTFRSIDVGVVLDVMIHDIDIVLSLARSKVSRIDAQGVSLIGGGPPGSPAEDICSARLTFENGCVANLTASRLSLKTERRLRVFAPEAYVSVDYQKKYGIVVRKTGNLETIREAVDRIRSGEVKDLASLDYTKIVKVEELTIDDVEPLRAQNEAFIASLAAGDTPVVSVEDGLAAVEVAERIVAAIPQQAVE
jgi:predicted dehydrogenase